MKNKFIIYALLASLVLSLSACGSNSSTNPSDDQTDGAQSEKEISEDDESVDINSGEKFASIEELLEHPEVSAEITNALGDLGDNMSMEVYGDGAKLVYSLQLLDMGGVDQKTMADAMEEAFAENKDGYVSIANMLKDVVDVPTPVVVIEILDPDNVVLFKELYPAE